MRHAHWLRPNTRVRGPVAVGAFDTETDTVEVGTRTTEQRLRFGWVAVSRRHRGGVWTPPRWYRFERGAELWEWVEEAIVPGSRLVLAAHNLGFDARVTDAFRELRSHGWTARTLVLEDPPTIMQWRKGERSLLLIDTLNYWRVPLAVLGDELGIPKLPMPEPAATRTEWDTYCRRDVEVVLAAQQELIRRIREWDLGEWAPTAAGLAWRAWRHRHMTAPVYIDANDRSLPLARSAYIGGRCEAWRVGEIPGPVYLFDVVSMYPAVMAEEPMPTRHYATVDDLSLSELDTGLAEYALVADVEVETDAPLFPVRTDRGIIYPVGRFRTVLASPELRLARGRDLVRSVHRAAVYERAPIFASYVSEWAGRKARAEQLGHGADRSFAKLMLNSLSGKFGQRGRRWEVVSDWPTEEVRQWVELDVDSGELIPVRSLVGVLQELVSRDETRDSHPAVAATITSAARVALWHLIELAGPEHVYYLDTDSLMVDEDAAGRLNWRVAPDTLGALRLERVGRWLIVHGTKDYTLDGERVTKGLRRNAQLVTPDEYEQEVFQRLGGAIASGNIHRQLVTRTRWRPREHYEGRTVIADGTTRPYSLGSA